MQCALVTHYKQKNGINIFTVFETSFMNTCFLFYLQETVLVMQNIIALVKP